MPVSLKDYQKVNDFLEKNGVEIVLYGSLGVSVYLGNFKEFNDIDLVVNKEWLSDKWSELIGIMKQNGFELVDQEKHEFINNDGVGVSFLENENYAGVKVDSGEIKVKTLSKEDFLEVYKRESLKRNKESDRYIIRELEKRLQL